jgi:hypothetical protein
MPKITNNEFVGSLVAATQQDRIDWQPTGLPQEFSASFGGKYTLLVRSSFGPRCQLDVKDSEGTTIVRIDQDEDLRISELYEMARRHALKIDEALADLLSEIDKPKN